MTHCKSCEGHFEIKKFVLFSVWNTPGLDIMKDKCMKRKDKLVKLVIDTGFYGPIMDVAIRGTVNHILVCYYGSDTKFVTDVGEGHLRKFLQKHFHSVALLEAIDALYRKNPQWILDYEYSYRHKRSSIVQSQILFLTQNPQNTVRTKQNLLLSFFNLVVPFCRFLTL